jgi:hypothetical protein
VDQGGLPRAVGPRAPGAGNGGDWLPNVRPDWSPHVNKRQRLVSCASERSRRGAVAGLVGIEGGVVSGVINLESSGVEAPDWRPRHDKQYHEA